MKRLFNILCAVLLLALTACQHDEIWEQLRDHEQRIEQLEKQCRELNSNVEALQAILAAVQQNDYVTEVMKVMEDGVEVGYSITFSKSGTITIYHGTNGDAGTTPQIGVRKAEDGSYYWTSNGEWITDENGDKIPAAYSDGGDGKYITPQFRIVDDVWYVSYDNGNSWRMIEIPAAGTGSSGGDTFFKDVIYDGEYICFILLDDTKVVIPLINRTENHWAGKKWYAYGTSLTSDSQGKYVPYVAEMSGLDVVNKGIAGGGIIANTKVRNAVMNVTDGKLEADLITLEVGANDASAPLGTALDNTTDTFLGSLTQCINYLLQNTNARIVVMSSPIGRYKSSGGSTEITPESPAYLERWQGIRDVCIKCGVHYIGLADESGMGWARLNNNMGIDYNTDNIHHTDIGGYNLAVYMWSKLKDIPCWYTSVGSDGTTPPSDEQGGVEYPFSEYGYLGPNGVLMDTYGDNVYYTTEYIDITKASTIYYHGRMGPVSNYYSIAFYDADKKFIPSLSICGTGNIETYYITLTDKYKDAVYVRGSWARGPNLDITATYDFVFIIDGKPAEKEAPKKRFAVLCDSIGTHGNDGEYCNVVEVEIGPEDVGVELNAYLTYYDVHDAGDRGKPTGDAKEFVIGGQTYTEADNGKLITFIPTAEDIGKKVGRVYDYNGNSMKTWWLWFAEAYNMEPIPVCWSSSSISSHETTVPRLVNSYAWHDSQVRKCGVRIPGSNDRIAPDYIIIARGTNDWSHSKGTTITDGYFDNPETWTYPTTDVVGTYYGIKEAVSLTVKNMRTAYPKAKIFLCTMPFNNRGGDFPGIYGGKSWISFNNAIKECAEFFGCGLIDFAACGLTQESLSIYTSDGTHLNASGHKLAGEKAIADFASQETTMYW